MIFHNCKENIDIDLDVKENVIVEEWIIDSHAERVTTLVGLNILDAIKILEKQGFERMGDIDPF